MRSLRPGELIQALHGLAIGRRTFTRTPFYSRDEMCAWQWQRISTLVRHAYETVPFYRSHYGAAGFKPGDLKTWDDFHALPSVRKDQVVENFPDRMIAKQYRLADLIVSRSSGSSGQALDIAYDSKAMITYLLAGLRLYGMGFPYRPWHRQLYIYTSPYPLTSLFGLYPMTFVSTLAPIPEIVQAMIETRPHLLVCYPSHLREIAAAMHDKDLAALPLRAISVNSEMSTQAERDDLARRFGCPVLDEYSSEELTRIAGQCRKGTYHVFEDINYMECIPDEARTDGIGCLVGTNLHNLAMPMIRYEQSDLGDLAETRCQCGWTFRALSSLEGRQNDTFVMPSGRRLSSGFLLDMTYDLLLTFRSEIRDFCLIQEETDEVLLEVVPGPGWTDDIAADVCRRLRQRFEDGVRVTVAPVTSCFKTKTGKRNPIISRVGR